MIGQPDVVFVDGGLTGGLKGGGRGLAEDTWPPGCQTLKYELHASVFLTIYFVALHIKCCKNKFSVPTI